MAGILFALFIPLYPFYRLAKKIPDYDISISRATKEKIEIGAATVMIGIVIIFVAFVAYLAFLYAWWLPFAFIGVVTSVILGSWGIYELGDKLYQEYLYSGVHNSLHGRWDRWRAGVEKRSTEKSHLKQVKPKSVEPKKTNIAWAYLKAKKSQVCPYIEWTEQA